LHNLALFWVKNDNFFAVFFGETILKIITSVQLRHPKQKRNLFAHLLDIGLRPGAKSDVYDDQVPNDRHLSVATSAHPCNWRQATQHIHKKCLNKQINVMITIFANFLRKNVFFLNQCNGLIFAKNSSEYWTKFAILKKITSVPYSSNVELIILNLFHYLVYL
jgi:hypothetical protein